MRRAQKTLLDLLSKPIAFHPVFVKIAGSVAAGVLLSQAYYWSKNRTAGERDGWFYKSWSEWEEETGLTRREQQTARAHLREQGLLEERDGGLEGKGRVLWFRVNQDKLLDRLKSYLEGSTPAQNWPAGGASEVPSAPAESAAGIAPNRPTGLHQSAQGVAPKRPTPMHRTARPVAPNRPTPPITSETTAETTAKNTHTRGALALAPQPVAAAAPSANAGVCVTSAKSRFSFEERKAHAERNGLGAGWLTNSRDGRYDELIEDQLERNSPEAIERALLTPRPKLKSYGAALMHIASVVSYGGIGSEPVPEIERLFETGHIDETTRDRLLARDWTAGAAAGGAAESVTAPDKRLANQEEGRHAGIAGTR